jgi:hypothetical protein
MKIFKILETRRLEIEMRQDQGQRLGLLTVSDGLRSLQVRFARFAQ